MDQLDEFLTLLSGSFDNAQQFEEMRRKGDLQFPFAQHINTVCNSKIRNLPENFEGVFLVEESYYTVEGKTHASPHLFLFTEEGDRVKLTSYELPEGCEKEHFTYQEMDEIEYSSLKCSDKFSPVLYEKKGDIGEGGSVSMFTPVLKFTLFERFSPECLAVSETMEVNGKRTFGYDVPILYRRIEQRTE